MRLVFVGSLLLAVGIFAGCTGGSSWPRGTYCSSSKSYKPIDFSNKTLRAEKVAKVSFRPALFKDKSVEYKGAEVYFVDETNGIRLLLVHKKNSAGKWSVDTGCVAGLGAWLKKHGSDKPIKASIPAIEGFSVDESGKTIMTVNEIWFSFENKNYRTGVRQNVLADAAEDEQPHKPSDLYGSHVFIKLPKSSSLGQNAYQIRAKYKVSDTAYFMYKASYALNKKATPEEPAEDIATDEPQIEE